MEHSLLYSTISTRSPQSAQRVIRCTPIKRRPASRVIVDVEGGRGGGGGHGNHDDRVAPPPSWLGGHPRIPSAGRKTVQASAVTRMKKETAIDQDLAHVHSCSDKPVGRRKIWLTGDHCGRGNNNAARNKIKKEQKDRTHLMIQALPRSINHQKQSFYPSSASLGDASPRQSRREAARSRAESSHRHRRQRSRRGHPRHGRGAGAQCKWPCTCTTA